jgi:hypothetical protein
MSNVEEHLKARSEFEKARNDLSDVADYFTRVSSALRQKPGQFAISNTSGKLPTEATRGEAVNGNDWKSAEDVMKLLARYHEARNHVRETWAAIPSDIRQGLRELPAGVLPVQDRYRR